MLRDGDLEIVDIENRRPVLAVTEQGLSSQEAFDITLRPRRRIKILKEARLQLKVSGLLA
jgi:hypothetical protein